jgi:transposase InsO family protein
MELQARGQRVSRPRVARLMKSANLRSIIRKKFRISTTDSQHQYPISKNHLQRNFQVNSPGKVWVSDITFIPTRKGWLYLTMILDLFDRKVIGWALSESMETRQTVLPAWKMALTNRAIDSQLIFHSDRGVQYASQEFRKALSKKVLQSMSRKGDCWDNAVAESFFKILKTELVFHVEFISKFQAKIEIFEFIEIWYNRQRRHSALGYCTPEEYGNKSFKNVA